MYYYPDYDNIILGLYNLQTFSCNFLGILKPPRPFLMFVFIMTVCLEDLNLFSNDLFLVLQFVC